MPRRTIGITGLLALAALTGCSGGTPPAPANTTVEVAPASTPVTRTTTTPAAGATRALGPFLAEARRADAALRFAAVRIRTNQDTSATAPDPATEQAYRQARSAVDAALAAVPAGLDARLTRQTLLVYSVLVARESLIREYRNAITDQGDRNEYHESARSALQQEQVPAGRFPADLAALRSAAAAHAPVEVRPHRSAAGAELAVRIQLVHNRNRCGDGSGGAVVTELDRFRWTRPPAAGRAAGLIAGAEFEATLERNGRWSVWIDPC